MFYGRQVYITLATIKVNKYFKKLFIIINICTCAHTRAHEYADSVHNHIHLHSTTTKKPLLEDLKKKKKENMR